MSEIIIALLMILLVIATIAAILFWNKSVFSKLTSDSKSCSEIDFTIGDFCYEVIGERISLKFDVRNELEDKEIKGFSVFAEDKYGNIQALSNLADESIAGFESKSLSTEVFSNVDLAIVRISPHLEVEGEDILCDNKDTIIKWDTIKPC